MKDAGHRTKATPESAAAADRNQTELGVADRWSQPIGLDEAPNDSTSRAPLITLPDEFLIEDREDAPTSDEEPATLRRVTASQSEARRGPLGSLDEASLVAELLSAAPERPASSRSPRRSTSSPPARSVEQLDLSLLPAFEDLPQELTGELLGQGKHRRLGPSNVVDRFELLLVVQGGVHLREALGGGPTVWIGPNGLVSAQCSEPGDRAPVVVGADPHSVAIVWQRPVIDRVTRLCPWFGDGLREEAERTQTLLYLARNQEPMAWLETAELARLSPLGFRRLRPGAVLFHQGAPVNCLVLAGKGNIELVEESGKVAAVLGAGQVVFGAQVVSGTPAPLQARAGSEGATAVFEETEVVLAALARLPMICAQLQSRGN